MGADAFDLSGRIAVVTGGGSGLGLAIATGLARHGCDVVVAGRQTDGLATAQQQIAQIGHRSHTVVCDVTNEDQVKHLFSEVARIFGRLDVLVNNAGIPSHSPPESLELSEWTSVIDTNMTGYWLCAKHAFELLKANRGAIVNVSSIAGESGIGRGNVAYSVSKAGVDQLTRELAVEWARYGIRINAVLPCQFRTAALDELLANPEFEGLEARIVAGIPLGRLGEPEDLVGPIVFLASSASAMVTGALLPVDGGNLAFNAGGQVGH